MQGLQCRSKLETRKVIPPSLGLYFTHGLADLNRKERFWVKLLLGVERKSKKNEHERVE